MSLSLGRCEKHVQRVTIARTKVFCWWKSVACTETRNTGTPWNTGTPQNTEFDSVVLFYRPGACFSKGPNLFGWHNSLCIFKIKESCVMKLCSYFNFYSLYNIWKDQLYRISGSVFYEWLFGPVKFPGLLRNARQVLRGVPGCSGVPGFSTCRNWFRFC